MKNNSTASNKADPRKHLYTLLQVGRADIGMDEEAYRLFLARHGAKQVKGRYSATTMPIGGLEAALEEMKAKGFKPTGKSRPRSQDWRRPRIEKITALWCALADAGVVRDRSEAAMVKWCAHHTKTAQLEWAKSAGLNACIEGLKSWSLREGVGVE